MIVTIKKKSIFAIILYLVIALPQIFSQNLNGQTLTSYIQEQLDFWNMNYERQELTPALKNNFPANLTVTFPAKKTDESQSNIHNVVFAMSQNFFTHHEPLIHSFLEFLKESQLSYTAIVLFSANDEAFIFDRESFPPVSGTRFFASSIYETSSYAAVCLYEKGKNVPFVICGGNGDISPWWLVYSINRAFVANGRRCTVPPPFLYKTSVQIAGEDSRVSSFLSREIASAGAFIDDGDEKLLSDIATGIESRRSSVWAKNYLYIPAGLSGFFIGESAFIAFFLISSLLILAGLCFISIVRNSVNSAALKDLWRTFFLIPLTIVITVIILRLISFAVSPLNERPFLLISLKLIFLTFFTLLIYLFQISRKKFVSFSASSYQLVIISAFNIFLFCMIHISFILIFIAIYLLCLFSSKQKNVLILTAVFFVTAAIQTVFFANMISFVEWSSMVRFLRSSLLSDTLLAFLLYPFQISLFRITVSLRIVDESYSEHRTKTLFRYARYVGTVIAALSLFFILIVNVLLKKDTTSSRTFITSDFKELKDFSVETSSSEFYGMKTTRLLLSSQKNITRYDVFISSEDGLPIYESSFDFTYSDDSTVRLVIPDFPPPSLEVIYSSDVKNSEKIRIEAYFMENGTAVHERYEKN